MPKVTPLAAAEHRKPLRQRGIGGIFRALFETWITHRRRRRSIGRIPLELLEDVVADEDIRTREQLRRTAPRPDTRLWF